MAENTFLPLYMDRVFIDIFGNIDSIKFSEYFLECFFVFDDGEKQSLFKTAKNMLLNKEPIEKIIKYTNLTAKEITRLI